jgi:pectate lyase
MKRHGLISFVFALSIFLMPDQIFSQSHDSFSSIFPGVKGFGLETRGGYGGRIIRVTTLSREGPGSLYEAIRAEGPRIVVFEVAGTINLNWRSLGIINPYITIAGQTAPYPGITLVRGGLNIGTHDVIIQHLKVRPGEAGREKKSGWEVDGIATVGGAYNVIIDHCSITWSTDENLSASGPQFEGADLYEWRENTSHRIVFSNCIIAEALSNSTHSKGEHSKGSLVHDNATDILIINNLYACNVERNPLFKGGVYGLIVNNYIFNPKFAAIHYVLVPAEWEGREWVTGRMGVEGNLIEYGPDTRSNMAAGFFRGPVEVYWEDNKVISGPEARVFTGEFTRLLKRPFWPEGLEVMPADKVKEYVLNNAGAFPWERDEIDERIIGQVRGKTGRIISTEKEGGGYPDFKPVIRKFNEAEWDMERLLLKAARTK